MKFSKLQLSRSIVQIIFLILLFYGFLFSIKPVLVILLPLALFSGAFFCGWVCPYGATQDFFAKLGSLFIKKKLKMPQSIQKYAKYSRYILTATIVIIFSKQVVTSTPFNAYNTFLGIATSQSVQVLAIVILVVFTLIAMFFDRPFCNYFCSEGIKYGLLSFGRLFTVKRNDETCVNCKKCDQACPMNIQISTKKHIRHAQCVNCFECITACPVENTMTFGMVRMRKQNEKPYSEKSDNIKM